MRIRRATACLAAMLIAAIMLAGCENRPGSYPPGSTVSAPTVSAPTVGGSAPAGDASCPVPASGAVEARSVLRPGPSAGLPAATAGGERLRIVAVVLDGSCQPAAGAIVYLWHTDSRGVYGPGGADKCCYYQGTVSTDHNGRFQVETIRPAQYPQPGAPPAHIHLDITHGSGQLKTEIIFTATSWPPASIEPSEVLPILLSKGTGYDGWYGEAAFMLRP